MTTDLTFSLCYLSSTLGIAAMYGWAAFDCLKGESLKACIRSSAITAFYMVLFTIKLWDTEYNHGVMERVANTLFGAPSAYAGLIL